jgi:formate hydrogenlyase subunit 3/multisubunit Na+/H+ antiporter MnhD subunit
MTELLIASIGLCCLGLLLALARAAMIARVLIGLGAASGVLGAISAVSHGIGFTLPVALADQPVQLYFDSGALWLMGFGLAPAALAIWLGTPVGSRSSGWLAGTALSLIGAIGVYGFQDGYSFLISWELMSLGGATMILSERLSHASGRSALFMLALLEVGAVALMLAILLLAPQSTRSMDFSSFYASSALMSGGLCLFIGILFLVGFGAKLGLLPFYEWFPAAYSTGSGASGAIMSGVVLNAAFFGLSRALTDWLPSSGDWLFSLGVVTTVVGVLSSILAVLYAFQQDDWRRLLSFSSAENSGIAVIALGASLIFREDGQADLAGLAWTVALLHLGGHALAKGAMFISADAIYSACGTYRIAQRGWIHIGGIALGIGALFSAMSLAAMPPQIGFATEWLSFQTVFQGFHVSTLAGRLTLALAGAGLALTAAIAFATFVKLFGIGMLGAEAPKDARISLGYKLVVLVLGVSVLASSVGLPTWLGALDNADVAQFGTHSAREMISNWLVVPLTNKFAFISPSKLAIALPLLAIVPLLLLLNVYRFPVRLARVWFGGLAENRRRAATTSLTFANAMRTFYSFIYRPTLDTAREHQAVVYFIRKVELEHEVVDVFGPMLFEPIRRFVWRLAGSLRALQSGDLNFYLALIGALLILILGLTLR